jgi:hypothetical protein
MAAAETTLPNGRVLPGRADMDRSRHSGTPVDFCRGRTLHDDRAQADCAAFHTSYEQLAYQYFGRWNRELGRVPCGTARK